MKFNQLRALAAVAKADSIQRAARDLHLSQPALSKSIRELERQLGVPLLVRGADGASLTPYGVIVAKRYLGIQREVDKVREEIDWLRGELGGQLTIGMSPPAVSAVAADTMTEFHRQFPAVAIQVLEQRPAQILDGLRNGAFDFGILHQYGDTEIADFETVTLLQREMLLAIGGAYTQQHPVAIDALFNEEWLASDLADDNDGYVAVLARHFDMPLPVRVTRCTSVALCLELAARMRVVSHWADTALPFLAAHFKTGGMTRLSFTQPLPAMRIVLAYRDAELLSPAAALFVRMLRESKSDHSLTGGDN